MNRSLHNIGFGVLLAFVVLSISAVAQTQDETVYVVGNGVSEPVPIQNVPASYTPEARNARVTGTIQLEAVVLADGSVTKVEVLKGLGYGLDEAAAQALSEWKFKPGTKDGKPVNVKIKIIMNFSLR